MGSDRRRLVRIGDWRRKARKIKGIAIAVATVVASSTAATASRRLPNLRSTKPLRIGLNPSKILTNLGRDVPATGPTFCFSKHHHRLSTTSSSSKDILRSRSSSFNATSAATTLNMKSHLRNRDTLYGLFLLGFSPTLAEICSLAGYDFIVVDMEHGPGGIFDALHSLSPLFHRHSCYPPPARVLSDVGQESPGSRPTEHHVFP